VQVVCPVLAWYFPVAQVGQAAVSLVLSAPALPDWPAGQLVQSDCPALAWYLPSGHVVQSAIASWLTAAVAASPLNLPAGQVVQLAASAPLYAPAAQMVQLAAAAALL
jgi:hypothetical protein